MNKREIRRFEKRKTFEVRYSQYLEYTEKIDELKRKITGEVDRFIREFRLTYYEEGKAILDCAHDPYICSICFGSDELKSEGAFIDLYERLKAYWKDLDWYTKENLKEWVWRFYERPHTYWEFIVNTDPKLSAKKQINNARDLITYILSYERKIEDYNQQITELKKKIKNL